MATMYKPLILSDDVVSTRTLLHESIPITGSIVSGTYVQSGVEKNIKNYSHGRFQSVYDYPVLSSSANHIFDLSVGFAPDSGLSGTTVNQVSKKIQIYNQMAQLLVGHDITGSIMRFDDDGDLISTSTKMKEVVFVNFSRLLVKDEIKKGSFRIQLGVGASGTPVATTASLADDGAQNEYRVNSPAGEYGILYKNSTTTKAGLIFYQAGIAVLTASVFSSNTFSGSNNIGPTMQTSSIEEICGQFRKRWVNCSFNNTTELNSTIYFCRINHNEFNYSSNPTYLSESQIRVKNTSTDAPVSYITTVGLYGSNNELLAVAKLSEPLKKDPTNEMILRVRLDY
jgi:hypothetical protein